MISNLESLKMFIITKEKRTGEGKREGGRRREMERLNKLMMNKILEGGGKRVDGGRKGEDWVGVGRSGRKKRPSSHYHSEGNFQLLLL